MEVPLLLSFIAYSNKSTLKKQTNKNPTYKWFLYINISLGNFLHWKVSCNCSLVVILVISFTCLLSVFHWIGPFGFLLSVNVYWSWQVSRLLGFEFQKHTSHPLSGGGLTPAFWALDTFDQNKSHLFWVLIGCGCGSSQKRAATLWFSRGPLACTSRQNRQHIKPRFCAALPVPQEWARKSTDNTTICIQLLSMFKARHREQQQQ